MSQERKHTVDSLGSQGSDAVTGVAEPGHAPAGERVGGTE